MIRVAFRYGDKQLFSRIVVGLRGGDSAHCEVAYAWSKRYHQCVSASFLDGGVRGKVIDFDPSKWRVYELDIDPKKATDWLEKHDGLKYDFLGILGIVIPFIKQAIRRWFCSEVGAAILGLSDPWRFDLALLESVCKLMGRRVTNRELMASHQTNAAPAGSVAQFTMLMSGHHGVPA